MSVRKIGKELLSQYPFLDGLFRRFVWSKVFFPENEMRFLNALQAESIDVAVDVGAATGSYTWILNRKSKEVYAFEPGHIHKRYLNKVNFGRKIKVIGAAVGSSCNRVSMYTPGSDSDALHSATLSEGNPVVSQEETCVAEVDQVTLDSFLSERLTPDRCVDLLKVDVEGYELEVFRGSIAILSKHHPLIICEIEVRHNANYSAVFELLKKLGYSCFIYREGGFELFSEDHIEALQSEDDLKVRLSPSYDPESNKYINNFVFQHPQSHIKVRT